MAKATAVFEQIAGDYSQSSTSNALVNIPGLQLTLPPAPSDFNYAFVTLNCPDAYVTAPDGPTSGSGILYGIAVDDQTVLTGRFTNQYAQDGRSPFTMIANVQLTNEIQIVQAQWGCYGGTAHTGDSASLSAVLVRLSS